MGGAEGPGPALAPDLDIHGPLLGLVQLIGSGLDLEALVRDGAHPLGHDASSTLRNRGAPVGPCTDRSAMRCGATISARAPCPSVPLGRSHSPRWWGERGSERGQRPAPTARGSSSCERGTGLQRSQRDYPGALVRAGRRLRDRRGGERRRPAAPSRGGARAIPRAALGRCSRLLRAVWVGCGLTTHASAAGYEPRTFRIYASARASIYT